jgi:hypothetical protein
MKAGVCDYMQAEGHHQIESCGLNLTKAGAAIIRETMIKAVALLQAHIDTPQLDPRKSDAPNDPRLHFSGDSDARWMKKDHKNTLGSGLITKIGQWPRARLQTGKPSDICRNGWRHVANLSGDQT